MKLLAKALLICVALLAATAVAVAPAVAEELPSYGTDNWHPFSAPSN